MTTEQQETLNEIFLGKEDPDMAFKKREPELDFLEEYKKLCLKHGFEIVGCGDCGSAWLGTLGEETLKHKLLVWEKGFEVIHFADDYDIEDMEKPEFSRIGGSL